MIRHILSIAAAVALATPTVSHACALNKHDSRTMVVSTASADCKFSDQEIKQMQAQLAKALASLSAQPAAPAVIAATNSRVKNPGVSQKATLARVEDDLRTNKQRRQFVENM